MSHSLVVARAAAALRTGVFQRICFSALLIFSCLLLGLAMGGQPAGQPFQPAELVGAWQLNMMIIDKNANNRLEDEERKDPILGAQDYMKLNADGSCELYTFKVKGRYEIKTSSSGYRTLVLFDKDNNKAGRGRIYSVTKDELILLDHSSGSTFKVFKRV